MVKRSDGILEKDCTKTAAEDKCGGFAASSSSLRCSLLCSLQPAGWSSSGERIRRTPYHWWNLSSPAAPWPSKPANDLLSLLEEGALTKGEGYGFSVTVCTQGRGLNLGLEQLGLSWIALGLRAQDQPKFGPDSAQIWPGSTPQPACVRGDCLWECGACRGSVAVWGRCYMRIYAWPARRGAGLHGGINRGAMWGQGSWGKNLLRIIV